MEDDVPNEQWCPKMPQPGTCILRVYETGILSIWEKILFGLNPDNIDFT